jgi:hypothetical protein
VTATALHRPCRLFAPPEFLLNAARWLPAGARALDRLTGSLELDDGNFRRTFGWTPPVAFADALARTAAWFLQNR